MDSTQNAFIIQEKDLKPSKESKRGQWANKREYILTVVGTIIGLGNVWRFPYLCFKNGGGVFLVPYFLFLLTCGIPIFFLEVSLGQMTGQGSITCWRKICPLLEGIGYGCQLIVVYCSMYYIVILAWAFLYLSPLFILSCPGPAATTLGTQVHYVNRDCVDHQNGSVFDNATSAVGEFWQRRVLGLSAGIEQMGSLRWDLVGCLILSWIICYFSVWKGIKSSGKVVYITALFPYLMLLVLLCRGVTLEGAADGIQFYLSPNITRLETTGEMTVWMDASSQILFSYAVCVGVLASMGSYNPRNNNCYRDAFMLCALNSLTSLVAGFAIFSVLGFMSHDLGVNISMVAESGPGLAFIAYPRGLAMMPVPHLWSVLFFIMIILLGVDSQFMYLEALMTSVSDMYPSFFLTGHRRKLLLLGICVFALGVSLFMVTEGGMYVFQIFDYYACSGIPVMFLAISETVCIGWIYGADRYYDNIADMIGYRPFPYIKYCWKFITPVVLTGVLLFSLVKFTPLKYNNVYEYPGWGYGLGLFLASSSVCTVPLWCVYKLLYTQGTFKQTHSPYPPYCCNVIGRVNQFRLQTNRAA
ncbi:hypothetical protein WMY93_000888 [Mugilogobius chulae]|uniref:Transporter n=1 Tax=Mugilogobius chulae TaxID=88201 RepID=A0AAW0QBC1_9GOBI